MPVEHRTRITILLPAPTNLDQFLLLDKVLTGLVKVCGGVTVSQDVPSVFDGWWINDAGRTVTDANVIVMADAPQPLVNIVPYLERVKRQGQQDFNQDIIWITTHLVERITTDDFVH